MDINKILSELDSLFASGQAEKAGKFLTSNFDAAISENDLSSALTILNELIGYYRVTTQFEKAEHTIQKINEIICKMDLSDTVTEGTSLLNIATIYRAMGDIEKAEKCYLKAENIYVRQLDENDYRIAGLYNNMSLMYQEQECFDKAILSLEKAMAVISKIAGAEIEIAVTHTNLGQIYCRTGEFEKAKEELDRAEDIFIQTDINDEHYSGLASAKGYLYCQLENYKESADYYEKALLSVYNSYGITENFRNLQSDLRHVYRLSGEKEYSSMLDVCEDYYEKFGRSMIHEKFPEYENKIAVGLCGEGSECFGMEDEISLDHDCGPCFAMWVTGEVYDQIGDKLQTEYEKLPNVFAGYIRAETKNGSGRSGVCRIDDFFLRVLGGKSIPQSDDDWRITEESSLAAAVNGRVFRDPLGIFTEKRNKLLGYYPHHIWIEKLAKELMYSAQTGQYNYGRSMSRGDYVAASIALSEYIQSTMHVVYLLNRTYSPYYKWQNRMLHHLEILPEIASIMEAICDMPSQREAWKDYKYTGLPNPDDMIAQTIEITAKFIVNALQEMNLSENNDPYLEVQGQEVLKHMNDKNIISREQIIDEIIRYEWVEFDMVRNKGGRASCQNDWDTFSIMRKSQYMTWTDDMLNEYLWHINDALEKGRNLITEKYGRMMQTASPEEYEEIKDFLPDISEERKKITEAIVQIQVEWMEEFSKNYPKMASNARSIRTSEDNMYNTSYETYLRGELGTYSDSLIAMYGRFIAELARNNKNLAYMTMENTAILYGYKDLDDVESKLA